MKVFNRPPKYYSQKLGAVLLLSLATSTTFAQQAAAPGPNAARQAIEARKAVFVLIANNFKPVGDTLQGKRPYDAADIKKRAARVAVLTDQIAETLPEISNTGLPDTKAKSEIWSDRAGFDKKLKEFSEHVATLVKVSNTETTTSDAFKAAAAAVAQDCKSCHEAYKVK